MTIIIEESKMNKLSEHIEEGLRHMGKAMQCVDQWMEESGMGERGGMNYRGGSYGSRYGQGGGRYGKRYDEMGYRGGYGMRDEDEWEDEEMGERRRRNRRTGRYM